jgi:RNA polymerase sigma-70 factor (ECF subfamily)
LNQQDLIESLKQREPEALTWVFNTYSDKIYKLAAGMLRDDQQADGVVQDTFIKLIEKIDTFEGRARINTWLYRVAYNECLGRLRRIRPDVTLDALLDNDFMPANMVDWQTIPDAVLYSQEAQSQVQNAIGELSPVLQAVFTLRDVEGLSTAETAAVLDISESAVKVRLHRARLVLREKLANYFEDYH